LHGISLSIRERPNAAPIALATFWLTEPMLCRATMSPAAKIGSPQRPVVRTEVVICQASLWAGFRVVLSRDKPTRSRLPTVSSPNPQVLASALPTAESWAHAKDHLRPASWSIAPTIAAATRSRCRPINGQTTLGCRTLSRGLSARRAASAARMSGRIGKAWSRNSRP
jgi:hypothetical protein